jgi:enoyl-CoA hydratase/carnithine racemase
MTGTYFLPRLVGDDVARELTFTGRVFDAREGAQLGLVTRLNDEPLTAARDIASSIAERNPDALRAAKRLLGGALNRSPAEQFAMERTEVHGLIGTPNQTEAIRANLEDRPAVFADPA